MLFGIVFPNITVTAPNCTDLLQRVTENDTLEALNPVKRTGKEYCIMRKLNIAVCDDEEYYRSEIRTLLTAYKNETGYDLTVSEWESAALLTEAATSGAEDYDLLFLDVEMPGLSGIDAAAKLRSIGRDTIICFVTAHKGYAYDAYGVDAVGYIAKPITYTDIKKIIETAEMYLSYRRNRAAAEKRYLEIISGRANIIIDLDKVVYIEKRRNQCVFHCTDGEQICYDSLRHIYSRLDHGQFLYIHQGYIANFPHVKEVLRDHVCFGSGMEAPLSRRYYETIRQRYMDKVNRIMAEAGMNDPFHKPPSPTASDESEHNHHDAE